MGSARGFQCVAVCWRVAQREGEDHVALSAGFKVYVIDERGSRQSVIVPRTQTARHVAVGHVPRDLRLAMKAERCRARATAA